MSCNTVPISLFVILSPTMVTSLLHSGPLIAAALHLPYRYSQLLGVTAVLSLALLQWLS
jgi:hypothetical protein